MTRNGPAHDHGRRTATGAGGGLPHPSRSWPALTVRRSDRRRRQSRQRHAAPAPASPGRRSTRRCRRPRRRRRVQRAGGRERGHQRSRSWPGPHRLHAAPPRPPAAAPCRWRRASTSSSRCRRRPTRSRCATASRTPPSGGGITAPLAVTVNGGAKRTMTLTSQYSWLYNQYPFTNDPKAGPAAPGLVDHRVLLRAVGDDPDAGDHHAVPPDPLLRRAAAAARQDLPGRRHRPAHRARRAVRQPSTVIDLLDSRAGRPAARATASRRTCCCSAPTRSAAGLRRRVRQGDRLRQDAPPQGLRPAGRLPGEPPHHRRRRDDRGRRQLVHDRSTGTEVALSTPAPDGSVHTGVGFYGKDASVGGSRNVHLSGFAIEGDVRERIDTDQVNGIGGALSDSTIDGLYIHHTKVGMWFDGPMTNLTITNNVIVDQIADGLNFHTGVTNSTVANNFVRNTGDDGLAMWSEKVRQRRQHLRPQHRADADARQRHRHLRRHRQHGVEQPDRRPDPRGQRHPGRLAVRRRGVHRAPVDHRQHHGAGRHVRAELEHRARAPSGSTPSRRTSTPTSRWSGDHFLDNTYNAIMLVADWPVKDLYSITNVHFKDIRVDGTGTSVLSARAMGSATFENVDARNVGAVGVNNCGSVPLHAGRLGVLAHRPRRQRRRRHDRSVAGAVGAAEHDHLRRPPAGGGAAGAVGVVTGTATRRVAHLRRLQAFRYLQWRRIRATRREGSGDDGCAVSRRRWISTSPATPRCPRRRTAMP